MQRLIAITMTLGSLILIGRLAETPHAWLLPYGPNGAPRALSEPNPANDRGEISHQAPFTPEVKGEEVQARLLGGMATQVGRETTSAGLAVVELFGFGVDASETSAEPLPASASDSPSAAEPITEANDDPPTSEVGFLVIRVVDGDTVELEGGERVRYIGIDTPESTTEHECYGEEAKARNRELVDGKRVTLVADAEDRDKYGRLLRYVYMDKVFINLTLTAEGYATQLTIPPNVAHANEFRDAVESARQGSLGLWSGCPIGEQNESSSRSRANYDETVPQANTTDCPADQPIKGNAQSMIYHLPGGDFYEKTKPEACFASDHDAESAGYRRSKR